MLLEDEEEGGRVIITSASQAGGHAIVHILVLASQRALMTPADRH